MAKYEVVFCIVNEGYSEAVMDSAREVGVTGGTVLHASGTANPQAERFFGITIEPNKEIVMIVVDSKIKEQVLHNLYRDVGLKTEGQGIAFTLPISDVVGLTSAEKLKKQADADNTKEQSETDTAENAESQVDSDVFEAQSKDETK